MHLALKFALIAACAFAPLEAGAQTANNLATLKGLAPFATLPNSPAGQAALAANFAVTGGIQPGVLRRPSLLPFAHPQEAIYYHSFPSGHTASSFGLAIMALMLTWRRPDCRWIGLAAIFWSSLVALRRIYSGVHRPTDILGGI